MKIYDRQPEKLVRLNINKIGEETQYLTLHETSLKEVERMCRLLIEKQNLSPFLTGNRTRIDIREAVGAKNGKSISLSFHGLNTMETYNLIVDHINKLNK